MHLTKYMSNHLVIFAAVFLLVASLASAQTVDPALRPPKGAQVALVVFEDLQCPDCRRAALLVEEAARTHRVTGDVEIVNVPIPVRANIVGRRHEG